MASHGAAVSPPEALQETLQLWTEESGKKAARYLQSSPFSVDFLNRKNKIPLLFQSFKPEKSRR
jgi:hypothetical protein